MGLSLIGTQSGFEESTDIDVLLTNDFIYVEDKIRELEETFEIPVFN